MTVVQWFRVKYPRYGHALFAIPNGAILCDLTAKKRRARIGYLLDEGLRLGVSDLFLALPNKDFHGLWLEMKDKNKTISSLSSEQKIFLFEMQKYGYCAQWAAGCDEAIDIILNYMADFDHAMAAQKILEVS